MKKKLFSLSFIGLSIISFAQVGIGTNSPNSTLSVEGSLETAYVEKTGNYTLTDKDHYVTYSGTTVGTFTLPAAGTGLTSYTGRIYKIKNLSTQNLTIQAYGTEKFRNSDTNGMSNFIVAPGNYVELVNNSNTTLGTWDVSYIAVPTPPTTSWQFDNIYDYTANTYQDITVNGTSLTGFSQVITIPANKAAKIVISYSIPLGTDANKYNFKSSTNLSSTSSSNVQTNLNNSTLDTNGGYYGVTFQKNGVEFPAGSRKSTVIPRNSSASYSMTTVSATVADNIASSTSAQTITYNLLSYLENVAGTVTYLMYEGKGTGADINKNFNWGKGYWSIMVYLK